MRGPVERSTSRQLVILSIDEVAGLLNSAEALIQRLKSNAEVTADEINNKIDDLTAVDEKISQYLTQDKTSRGVTLEVTAKSGETELSTEQLVAKRRTELQNEGREIKRRLSALSAWQNWRNLRPELQEQERLIENLSTNVLAAVTEPEFVQFKKELTEMKKKVATYKKQQPEGLNVDIFQKIDNSIGVIAANIQTKRELIRSRANFKEELVFFLGNLLVDIKSSSDMTHHNAQLLQFDRNFSQYKALDPSTDAINELELLRQGIIDVFNLKQELVKLDSTLKSMGVADETSVGLMAELNESMQAPNADIKAQIQFVTSFMVLCEEVKTLEYTSETTSLKEIFAVNDNVLGRIRDKFQKFLTPVDEKLKPVVTSTLSAIYDFILGKNADAVDQKRKDLTLYQQRQPHITRSTEIAKSFVYKKLKLPPSEQNATTFREILTAYANPPFLSGLGRSHKSVVKDLLTALPNADDNELKTALVKKLSSSDVKLNPFGTLALICDYADQVALNNNLSEKLSLPDKRKEALFAKLGIKQSTDDTSEALVKNVINAYIQQRTWLTGSHHHADLKTRLDGLGFLAEPSAKKPAEYYALVLDFVEERKESVNPQGTLAMVLAVLKDLAYSPVAQLGDERNLEHGSSYRGMFQAGVGGALSTREDSVDHNEPGKSPAENARPPLPSSTSAKPVADDDDDLNNRSSRDLGW